MIYTHQMSSVFLFITTFLTTLAYSTSTSDTPTRSGTTITIDFDVPRYGGMCVSVDEADTVKFVWDEYHNLHRMPNEESYQQCDFSSATKLADAVPNPTGVSIPRHQGQGISTDVMFFSCSKICDSNDHKVRVCVGGSQGENDACLEASECTLDRTHDMRTKTTPTPPMEREYVQGGMLCRPKNSDGYASWTKVDTPQSCQEKCNADGAKCGAWEFEHHTGDDRECELHEKLVISMNETSLTGKCQFPENDNDLLGYRCCWILKNDVLDVPTDDVSMDDVPMDNPFEDEKTPNKASSSNCITLKILQLSYTVLGYACILIL
mmetsp:Transcript_39377/g.47344  ORF Transcript_39377/g.47344 Transcript_39377/m.47344 type:complete len:321 (+) Transcript_39377:177-1139(+)